MITNRICIACNKRPARIKFIKVVDGKWQECVICQHCAMRLASQQGAGAVLRLDHVLKGLMEEGNQVSESPGSPKVANIPARAPQTDLTCGSCGLSYMNYRSSFILGCSECYHSFHDRLVEDLRRFHGSTTHKGRRPSGMGLRLNVEAGALVRDEGEGKSAGPIVVVAGVDLGALRRQLQEAVAAEDFALAARLRDEILAAEARQAGGQQA